MRRLSRVLGWIAVAVSVGYLVGAGMEHARELDDLSWNARLVASLAAGLGLYGAALACGALAWALLLKGLEAALPPVSAVTIVLRSNLAKYLPGNVGHYLGRAALARSAGVPMATVLASLTVETVLTLVAGLLFAAACARGLLGHWLASGAGRGALLAPALLAVLLAGAALAALHRYRSAHRLPRPGTPPFLPGAGPSVGALGLYTLSFASLGLAVTVVARGLMPLDAGGFPLLAGAFAVAWIAGFIVPGSPGGLGVREAVLVAELDPVLGGGAALTLAVLFRLVTVAGDAVAFAAGTASRIAPLSARREDAQ